MENKNRLGCRIQIRKIVEKFKNVSLVKKLFLINLSILMLLFAIYFVGFSKIFEGCIITRIRNHMEQQLSAITEGVTNSIDFISEEEIVENISEYLRKDTENVKCAVWLINSNGECKVIDSKKIRNIHSSIYEDEWQDIVNSSNGYFDVYFKHDIILQTITVDSQVKVDEEVKYDIYMHTSLYQISEVINNIRGILLLVICIVWAVLFGIGYSIYRKIIISLRELNTTAKTIAEGQFYNRVEVRGDDEIAQLAKTFNYMAIELDKIEEHRRDFISNISHDLRSPLTSIQGFITAILDGTISQKNQEKYLNIILNESSRMVTMTNEILELNRTEESREKLTKTIFDIHQVIEQSMDSLENRVKVKNITLEKKFTLSSGEVIGNVDDITRVIQNLLDNALKFVDENGFIEIRTAIRGKRLWVAIYNSGPPIPKEQQAKIWSKFYKGDTSRGIDKTGIGLGLVIVKEIIRQHGEVVGVHSEEGEPIIFYFSLAIP